MLPKVTAQGKITLNSKIITYLVISYFGEGKWDDENCAKKNLVVCQKYQIWTESVIQQLLLKERKQLEELLNQLKNQQGLINDQTNQIKALKTSVDGTMPHWVHLCTTAQGEGADSTLADHESGKMSALVMQGYFSVCKVELLLHLVLYKRRIIPDSLILQ